MEENKKKRLISKGYKIESFSEILNLTPAETDYVKFKLFLSKSVKMNRERRGLTQQDFAKLIKSSQSRVAKMESCDPSVSIDLLIKALMGLGVSIRDLLSNYENESREKKNVIYALPSAYTTELHPLLKPVVQRPVSTNSAEDNFAWH